ncbi:hypothetical protein [Actinoplanes sp. NPDC051851]|uniref:hypothetical protein n=1 Tax=Actinoplanes sp. NPDC051851 TaxID=3154753 RepID=UPI003419963C
MDVPYRRDPPVGFFGIHLAPFLEGSYTTVSTSSDEAEDGEWSGQSRLVQRVAYVQDAATTTSLHSPTGVIGSTRWRRRVTALPR